MKNKHITFDERKVIENQLNNGMTFTDIAKLINKDRTTIAKEVKARKLYKLPNSYGRNVAPCNSASICADVGTKICKADLCPHFEPTVCIKLTKAPYVCNGCPKKQYCKFVKYKYSAKAAQKDYIDELKASRSGPRISKDEIQTINKVVGPLLKEQNQSINHIFIYHPDELYFSKTTFYKYVQNNMFSFNNFDLQRKLKRKRNKNSKKRRTRTESLIRMGRTYEDYLFYVATHQNSHIVQMDTVEGIKGGKVLLTLLFVEENLMLIYLLEHQNTECVTKVFEKLRKDLGDEKYHELFEVILTDNGSEFFHPMGIEVSDETGEILSNVFYCDPEAPYQKGDIEKNHEFIRYIFAKGTSFDNLTQEDCNLMASHINSTARAILGNKTPYELAEKRINTEVLAYFGILKINCDDVTLSKKIFKRK